MQPLSRGEVAEPGLVDVGFRGHTTVRRSHGPQRQAVPASPRCQGRGGPRPHHRVPGVPGRGPDPDRRRGRRSGRARVGRWAGPAASPFPGPERPLSSPETAAPRHPDTRAEWRAWLADHHDASNGVWLLFWRKQSGRTGLSYEEAVQEALCFGWIDSKGAKLDDQRTMLWMSPRKRGSGWARTNKARIEQLL